MKTSNHKSSLTIFALTVLMVFYLSCQKNSEPPNPFDNINNSIQPTNIDTLIPYSIQGLHKNIFSKKCSSPGCHDGNFEPDYRTIQSTYSTLVYQKPIKNDSLNSFQYRVKPYDTTMSWLHERLTTDDAVLGQMPLYSTPLSKAEMNNINQWIMNGAPDQLGNPAVLNPLPNSQPILQGYGAYIGSVQIDTNRINQLGYNPFIINSQTTFNLFLLIADDSTAVQNLSVNQLKVSQSKDDFSSATVYNATFINIPGVGDLWYVTINAATLPQNKILYMRYYTNDGDHVNNMEYPQNSTMDYFKLYYAFFITP